MTELRSRTAPPCNQCPLGADPVGEMRALTTPTVEELDARHLHGVVASERGITEVELARRLGVAPPTVSKIARRMRLAVAGDAESRAPISSLLAVARACGVKIEIFVSPRD